MKNSTYYFYNNIIDLKDLEPNLLKIDKKHYKGINIYYTGYITIKKIDEHETISRVNPLYLRINHASGYIDSVDKKKKYLKNTQMFEMELKTKPKQ